MQIKSIIFFLSAGIFLLAGCSDNPTTPVKIDQNILFSADELTCDYHDSTSFHFPYDTTIYQVYRKLILLNITDRSFGKVNISGSIDSCFSHDTLHGYNISLHLDLKKDTSHYYYELGDTDVYIAPLLQNISNFDDTLYVTYAPNDTFNVLFTMLVANPSRGDFIKVKNLKIYKAY